MRWQKWNISPSYIGVGAGPQGHDALTCIWSVGISGEKKSNGEPERNPFWILSQALSLSNADLGTLLGHEQEYHS